MSWNGSGLDFFIKNDLLPAFHAAGLSTKVLALDWNWDTYASYGAPTVYDSTIRNDPLFGGIAWHGYGGAVSEQTTVHNQYPNIDAYDTEHSGGTWIANQQNEDMNNIINYTRNWGKTVTKWSLAVDQNMGPHNGGCGTCTGLITVHNGDSRSGQVDYTIEYYDMGQLTKFVKPGALPDRLHRQQHHSERGVAEPGRVEGADRLQRHRKHPADDGELGQREIHLQPPGGDVGHLHLERGRRLGRHAAAGTGAIAPFGGNRASTTARATPPTAPPCSSMDLQRNRPRRAGPSPPMARFGRWVSAWTWPVAARRTARRCSCTTATAPAPSSGNHNPAARW